MPHKRLRPQHLAAKAATYPQVARTHPTQTNWAPECRQN